MTQRESETINQFATRLRTVLSKCKFDSPEARLTDALIFGMKNATVRNKILTEDDPTLQSVIKLAQTAEVADAAAKELKEHEKKDTVSKISVAVSRAETTDDLSPAATDDDTCLLLPSEQARQPRYQRPSNPCPGCRGNHPRQRCPFRDAICRRCNRRGHIAEACRAPLPEESFSTPRQQRFNNQAQQPRDNKFSRGFNRRHDSTANRDYAREGNGSRTTTPTAAEGSSLDLGHNGARSFS
ncbi:uncharacterized protein [Erythrolamprus reginae]|uniref:uncharacterized protein n=1 Tax=Erythrolamprus reginae TaxID=121349 RepID=UPI00396CF4A3